WQYLYKGAYWRRGPVTMCSIAAVDTALWDIKGKALNVPVYQLLGGASHDGVLVYGHASGQDIEDTVQAVAEYRKLGYKAIRAQSGIPRLQSTYGVGRGKMYYEPAEKGAPVENAWSTDLYLNFVPRLFERLRKEFGEDLPLLHDVHHRLTPIEAARLGKSLEPFHLFWLEDPVPAELQESLRLIRRHTTTPLAIGEVFNSIYDCQQLIQAMRRASASILMKLWRPSIPTVEHTCRSTANSMGRCTVGRSAQWTRRAPLPNPAFPFRRLQPRAPREANQHCQRFLPVVGIFAG